MSRRGIANGALVEIESVAEHGRRRLLRDFMAHTYNKSIPVFVRAQEPQT